MNDKRLTSKETGTRIADLRREKGMSPQALANAVGRHPGSWVNHLEAGLLQATDDELMKISAVLGADVTRREK